MFWTLPCIISLQSCVCLYYYVCDQVMAIAPSHFIWQRERPAHHSGAQRQYRDREEVLIPRGPAASPEPCALCAEASRLSPSPLPLTLSLSLQERPKTQKLVRPQSKASYGCTHSPAGEAVNRCYYHNTYVAYINNVIYQFILYFISTNN